jgi:hypothetical protein
VPRKVVRKEELLPDGINHGICIEIISGATGGPVSETGYATEGTSMSGRYSMLINALKVHVKNKRNGIS